eukprot:COSAG05_NODE_5256_length_1223_cov_0.898577_1_plen_152_part_00
MLAALLGRGRCGGWLLTCVAHLALHLRNRVVRPYLLDILAVAGCAGILRSPQEESGAAIFAQLAAANREERYVGWSHLHAYTVDRAELPPHPSEADADRHLAAARVIRRVTSAEPSPARLSRSRAIVERVSGWSAHGTSAVTPSSRQSTQR